MPYGLLSTRDGVPPAARPIREPTDRQKLGWFSLLLTTPQPTLGPRQIAISLSVVAFDRGDADTAHHRSVLLLLARSILGVTLDSDKLVCE